MKDRAARRAYGRAYMATRYARLLSTNLCTVCESPVEPGRRKCRPCLDDNNQHQMRRLFYMPNDSDPKTIINKAKGLYDSFMEAGFTRETVEGIARAIRDRTTWEDLARALKLPLIRVAMELDALATEGKEDAPAPAPTVEAKVGEAPKPEDKPEEGKRKRGKVIDIEEAPNGPGRKVSNENETE